MCFYKISLMWSNMDLELSIHKDTAHSDGSFLTVIIQISTFFKCLLIFEFENGDMLIPRISSLKVAIPRDFSKVKLCE